MDASLRQRVLMDVPEGMEVEVVSDGHGDGPMRTAVEEMIVVRAMRRGRSEPFRPSVVTGGLLVMFGLSSLGMGFGILCLPAAIALCSARPGRLQMCEVLRIGATHLYPERGAAIALDQLRTVEVYRRGDDLLDRDVFAVTIPAPGRPNVVLARFDEEPHARRTRALLADLGARRRRGVDA